MHNFYEMLSTFNQFCQCLEIVGKHLAALGDTPPALTEKFRLTEFEPFPKVQPGVKTEEAWALPEKGTINSATVLGAIGEFNLVNLVTTGCVYNIIVFYLMEKY